jgi:hypothetical protein
MEVGGAQCIIDGEESTSSLNTAADDPCIAGSTGSAVTTGCVTARTIRCDQGLEGSHITLKVLPEIYRQSKLHLESSDNTAITITSDAPLQNTLTGETRDIENGPSSSASTSPINNNIDNLRICEVELLASELVPDRR